MLFYALSRGRVAPDAVDGMGRSLLFVAAVHQRHATVQFLLDNARFFDLDRLAASGWPARPRMAAAPSANRGAAQATRSCTRSWRWATRA